MFPFWEVAIAPVLEAAKVRRVVEIGAFRGETTVLMLDRLGLDAELHVIDPVPEFDPAEHEATFPGRYIFHRDLSLNVLLDLEPMDAALIDGDHNWYTVYHELGQLSTRARNAGAPLPVMILHDVCWPYGRRDLYYSPDSIPEEYRQPYAQQGMKMGRKKLLPRGGLNPTMFNALVEGGPRNGVMTAIDDFIAEYDRPLRRLVLPIYFGLAIVVEEDRLARQPEISAVLDRLEGVESRADLLELAEEVRLQAMLFQHNVFFSQEQRLERAADRYLGLLKGALLNEHYIEQELRIDYLASSSGAPDLAKLRDPMRQMRPEMRTLQAARRAGQVASDPEGPPAYFPYTTMGRVRLDHLERCFQTLTAEHVRGDLVEMGTGRGGGAIFLRGLLDAHEVRDRTVWVADEFRSSPRHAPGEEPAEPGGGRGFPDLLPDLNTVREGFLRFDLLDDQVRFLVGPPAETLADPSIGEVALLRIGDGVGVRVESALEAVYDRIAVGGYVVVDDHNDPACKAAVDAFRSRHDIDDPVERIDWTGVHWRKSGVSAVSDRNRGGATTGTARVPLAPPMPATAKDLSVVVVFYNMRREAARTLHSLARSYQQDIDDLDYEVVVVENGSADDQRLGEEYVRSFGPEFRYLDLAQSATSSPVPALNAGIGLAQGEVIALMIDGAHVLTPGVLRFAMQGLRQYEPALVATQQWYVGPGQQGDVMIGGYDQTLEDRLFEDIEWPVNGYRLFDIGHFIGDRDWFDGLWESNCIFVPRKLLEQSGCFEESFDMAGGGYANLEIYERLGSSPDTTIVTIIGEGSFHQVHGGTTTNQAESDERRKRITSYAQHYSDLRGRTLRGPGKPIHYVGAMRPHANRTRARHRAAPNLFKKNAVDDPDGLPSEPTPMPESLREEFVEAFWRTLAWRQTRWLGARVDIPPSDLVVYQELLSSLRPDWVIETGTGPGGRALFLASVCELLGHGQVVSIDRARPQDGERPQHPRITYLAGHAPESPVVAQVRELVGASPNALVILGSGGARHRMVQDFTAYAPFVPVGGYLVVEQTIVNGHPVWASHGPGPAEMVKKVLNTRDDFAPDPTMERYGVTFNPDGFLKRIR